MWVILSWFKISKNERFAEQISYFSYIFHCFSPFMPKSESLPLLFSPLLFTKEWLWAIRSKNQWANSQPWYIVYRPDVLASACVLALGSNYDHYTLTNIQRKRWQFLFWRIFKPLFIRGNPILLYLIINICVFWECVVGPGGALCNNYDRKPPHSKY